MLHGFAGSPEDWVPVVGDRFSAVALALPGHHVEAPPPRDFDDAVERLLERLPKEPVHLVGYSLGGRLALGVAARAPARVKTLFLIAAHVGLSDAAARARRLMQDRERAARLRADPGAFFRAWDALPLFLGPARAFSADAVSGMGDAPTSFAFRARRAGLDADALADVLERLSPGQMPPLDSVLRTAPFPTAMAVGALDETYNALSSDLSARCPRLVVEVIPGAGHRVLVDAPDALGRTLAAWVGG